uniref:Uncharacterized protein n=1 Tax=Arundo donax TaxID=35708 RepID=A0A0A9G8P3_ARUDO
MMNHVHSQQELETPSVGIPTNKKLTSEANVHLQYLSTPRQQQINMII